MISLIPYDCWHIIFKYTNNYKNIELTCSDFRKAINHSPIKFITSYSTCIKIIKTYHNNILTKIKFINYICNLSYNIYIRDSNLCNRIRMYTKKCKNVKYWTEHNQLYTLVNNKKTFSQKYISANEWYNNTYDELRSKIDYLQCKSYTLIQCDKIVVNNIINFYNDKTKTILIISLGLPGHKSHDQLYKIICEKKNNNKLNIKFLRYYSHYIKFLRYYSHTIKSDKLFYDTISIFYKYYNSLVNIVKTFSNYQIK